MERVKSYTYCCVSNMCTVTGACLIGFVTRIRGGHGLETGRSATEEEEEEEEEEGEEEEGRR